MQSAQGIISSRFMHHPALRVSNTSYALWQNIQKSYHCLLAAYSQLHRTPGWVILEQEKKFWRNWIISVSDIVILPCLHALPHLRLRNLRTINTSKSEKMKYQPPQIHRAKPTPQMGNIQISINIASCVTNQQRPRDTPSTKRRRPIIIDILTVSPAKSVCRHLCAERTTPPTLLRFCRMIASLSAISMKIPKTASHRKSSETPDPPGYRHDQLDRDIRRKHRHKDPNSSEESFSLPTTLPHQAHSCRSPPILRQVDQDPVNSEKTYTRLLERRCRVIKGMTTRIKRGPPITSVAAWPEWAYPFVNIPTYK